MSTATSPLDTSIQSTKPSISHNEEVEANSQSVLESPSRPQPPTRSLSWQRFKSIFGHRRALSDSPPPVTGSTERVSISTDEMMCMAVDQVVKKCSADWSDIFRCSVDIMEDGAEADNGVDDNVEDVRSSTDHAETARSAETEIQSVSVDPGIVTQCRLVFQPSELALTSPTEFGLFNEDKWKSLPSQCKDTIHGISRGLQGALAYVGSRGGVIHRGTAFGSKSGCVYVTVTLEPSVAGTKEVYGILKSVKI